MLIGRAAELAALTDLVDRARDGASGALVVHGEAGIGKSALLSHTAATTVAVGVQQVAGVEAEVDFAYAGLHRVCAPLLEHLGALPAPQQHALGVALGLRSGPAPDRFLTGLATLGLLAEATAHRPLLCLVDDAQWLDTASKQALAFAARRLDAEQVVLVFAVRELDREPELAGLAELAVPGLGADDARALLAAQVRVPLDEAVRERIVAEARGNPLALAELPRTTRPADLAGGFALPDATPVPRRVEESYRQRVADLPEPTRLILLVAAAEPLGVVALLHRACRHLGVDPDALAPAEAAGLLEVGDRVRFHHPLARSAVYHSATPPQRRRAHAALAAATDPATDPDRRAWHRARAVLGLDDEVAAELERSADRATARGGLAAAGAFLARAAALTEEPTDRARRVLAAATALDAAGAPQDALALLDLVGAGPTGPAHDAGVRVLRARVAFHRRRGGDAPALLLDAATALTPLDPPAARETYLQAVEASMLAGQLAGDAEVRRLHAAVHAAPPAPTPPRPADLLLDALTTHATRGYPASVPALRRVVLAFLHLAPSGDPADLHRLWLGGHAAMALWDDGAAHTLAWRNLRLTREAGALDTLPFALSFLATVLIHTGELERVTELVAENDTTTEATGAAPLPHAGLLLAAWRGRYAEAVARHATAVRDARARGEGTVITIADHGLAVLCNGLGRYGEALAAARRVHAAGELVHTGMVLPELVEAAVRGGDPDGARDPAAQLGVWARAADTPWAHGLAARARALTSHGVAADEAYRESLTHLGRCRVVGARARSHLVYGEWLRREGRRTDAREQLRTAHHLLSGTGAAGFATRAAQELAATGEHLRARVDAPVGTTEPLTERERQIARLVATGATSREVGAQLFLSPRTVDAHLRNIFRKLDLTSRRQLRDAPLT